ncbi:HIT family protein [Faecalimicrobium sp. JNUCC 81]
MKEWQKNRIESAKNGTNPMLMIETNGGFAVFGDTQFLPGYCVLLPKKNVFSLNDLSLKERETFLVDLSILGDAIIEVCNPIRINYDVLGNTDKFLHGHVFPRYEWESEERKKKPVWLYDESNWFDSEKLYNECKHKEIRKKITQYLKNYYQI